MSQILVGIDVSLRTHHVHFMTGNGDTIADFSIPNNREGADTLIQRLLDKARKAHVADLCIGMEATDQYSWHIAHYLQEQLKGYEPDYQTKVYVLNAKKVARFKKGYDTFLKKRSHRRLGHR
ncbi:transposase [Terrilactibacillus sp. S3-3]|nr:transposase [Terrilactibacillus sp. S3-3]